MILYIAEVPVIRFHIDIAPFDLKPSYTIFRQVKRARRALSWLILPVAPVLKVEALSFVFSSNILIYCSELQYL